jgi:23S rRNA pseudouridine2457 synthase
MHSRSRERHILFHKPWGVVAQFTGDSPTLRDYISVPGVYPAGRLDKDSEGLLLLTSDGRLQHRLTDPRHGHPRTYWVQVEGEPAATALEQLSSGVTIQGYRTLPAMVCRLDGDPPGVLPRDPPIRLRKSIPDSWLELTLTEGKNRQVRHMTAAVGHPTLRLIRSAIGPVRIEGLGRGVWRDLRPDELRLLEMQRFTRTVR